jgi:hypothetical protein
MNQSDLGKSLDPTAQCHPPPPPTGQILASAAQDNNDTISFFQGQ